jgi:hypothetical protein
MTEVITKEMEEIRHMIAETVARRNALKLEMQEWYDRFPGERFAKLKDLITTDGVLSQLDTHYKQLWDFHNSTSKSA